MYNAIQGVAQIVAPAESTCADQEEPSYALVVRAAQGLTDGGCHVHYIGHLMTQPGWVRRVA